ncbi:hypothetical protein DFR31_1035 [Alkalispirillum mobile]|uniref:Probable membrane transporter protein n=1 Tax=Alkalispirillum mobile TaxID=85925 RepID=A0A498C7Q8_9GAMM|nr:hypothetical protein DFR31_1035 [Alkalispirillum mobile]
MESLVTSGELTPGIVAYATLAVFLAGIVRGYTGFGFSALVLLLLSLVFPPAAVVPVLLLLEIIASLHMLPAVWRQVDRRILTWLMLGSCISVPAGVFLLASLPDDMMRLIISLLVLASALLLWTGFRFRSEAGRGLVFGTGIVSGAMTGAAGVGGLIVVVMFLSANVSIVVVRATMVAFLLLKDILTIGVAGAYALVSTYTLLVAGAMVVPLFIGIKVGHRLFNVANPDRFKQFVLVLLMVLSVAGVARAILS